MRYAYYLPLLACVSAGLVLPLQARAFLGSSGNTAKGVKKSSISCGQLPDELQYEVGGDGGCPVSPQGRCSRAALCRPAQPQGPSDPLNRFQMLVDGSEQGDRASTGSVSASRRRPALKYQSFSTGGREAMCVSGSGGERAPHGGIMRQRPADSAVPSSHSRCCSPVPYDCARARRSVDTPSGAEHNATASCPHPLMPISQSDGTRVSTTRHWVVASPSSPLPHGATACSVDGLPYQRNGRGDSAAVLVLAAELKATTQQLKAEEQLAARAAATQVGGFLANGRQCDGRVAADCIFQCCCSEV